MANESHPGTAVVTGASGGIGLALARLFARDRFDVVLVARDTPRLEAAARELQTDGGPVITTLACDLAIPGAGVQLFSRLDAAGIVPSVFVNNAGFGLRGPLSETSLATDLEIIQVNVTALTELTWLALDRMRRRGSGRILNVASTAAFQPGPFMSVYYASKAYVLSFSEAVAYETRGTGISVTTLCPGPTATGFEARSGMSGSRLFRMSVVDADSVARAGYAALMRRKRLAIRGLRNYLVAQSVRLAPRRAALAVAAWLQK